MSRDLAVAVEELDSGENIAVGVEDLEGMSAEEPPGWLPDGWLMKVEKRKDGQDERYYIAPESGHIFSSELEVLHHLNIENVTSQALELVCTEYDNQHIAEQSEASPLWLPAGWILEIRARKNGYKYKCYFDPSTSSRFYSKAEVFRHLEDRESCSLTPKRKRCVNRDNVLAQIEISPDGLPSGWIKEIKFRRNASGLRKDPYYTDLMSGLVFRSRMDVNRYLETGEISRHATRTKKRSLMDMFLVGKESPPSIAARKLKWHGTTGRRCLFSGQIPNSSGKMGQEIGESYAEEPGLLLPYHDSPQCVKDDCSEILTLSDGTKQDETLGVSGVLAEKPLDLVEEKLKQDAEKLLEPANEETLRLGDKNSPDSPNCKSFRHTETNTNPFDTVSNVKLLEATNGKTEKLLELVYDKLPESSSTKSPKLESRKIANEESSDYKKPFEEADMNLTDPPSEKPLEPEDKLAELVNEKLSERSSGKLDEEAKGHASGSRRRGPTKAKSVKMITSPLRASKRLAGVEADTTAAFEIDAPSHKKARRSALAKANSSELPPNSGDDNSVWAQESSGKLEVKDTVVELTDLKEKSEAGNSADDKTESTMTLPFGDSWPDPCIEFAFKTLTGDIPLFEDTGVVQDYFHQQLATAETPSCHGCSDSVGDILTQLETTGHQSLPCSLDGELQPGRNAGNETKKEEGEPLTVLFR